MVRCQDILSYLRNDSFLVELNFRRVETFEKFDFALFAAAASFRFFLDGTVTESSSSQKKNI